MLAAAKHNCMHAICDIERTWLSGMISTQAASCAKNKVKVWWCARCCMTVTIAGCEMGRLTGWAHNHKAEDVCDANVDLCTFAQQHRCQCLAVIVLLEGLWCSQQQTL